MSRELLPALTPFDPATMIQSVDADGCGLRIAFDLRGDRYRHVVVAVEQAGSSGEHVAALLESVEGSAAEAWPASPPLQSLSIERRATGGVALLVGMAGRNHWSLSVEALAEQRCLEFDVACRAGTSAGGLGSAYAPGEVLGFVPAAVCQVITLEPKRLALPGVVKLIPSIGTLAESEGDRLRLVPAEPRNARTMRWKYQLQLAAKPANF